MTHSFNRTILREYDVRGVVGQTLFVEDAYALGRSYAALAVSEGAKRVAVGRDGRTHSPEMESALVRGLTEGGLNVVRIGMGPSPMLYFAVSTLDVDGGVQVTGSHNPADYNGFKMLLNGRSVFGAEIQDLGRRAAEGDWSEGQGKVEETDIVEAYVDALVKGFDGEPYRIGWDAGNGAGGPILDKLVKRLPGEHHTLYTEVDGRFPNHHPDPTVEANLADLKKLVADKNLDFGIAFDGDADRIGAVDAKGRVIWGDQLLIILAAPVLKELPGATIIADVKASQTLFDRIAEMGGKPLMWKTGHSLIKSKMKETGAPLAGEMSGHIFFKHLWYGFDDALYAAVRLIRAVSASGKSLTELKDEMPVSVATPELRFQVDEARKFAVIGEVAARLAAEGAEVNSTDGVRVKTADGWWLLRASNTQDVLVARAEAKDQPGLDRLMATVNEQLEKSGIAAVEAAH
jgi:phosphomannomutase